MSLNDVDFTGKMQAGRDLAALRRHRDTAPSRPKYAKRAPAEDTPENRMAAELAYLRTELAERDNTIAVLRSSGGADIEPIDAAGEFDRLFASAKKAGPGLPAEPHVTDPRTLACEGTRGSPMTKTQYLSALKKLGLTVASKDTAAALGVSVRQCQKYAAGDVAVPETIALLIAMYLEHGLPE